MTPWGFSGDSDGKESACSVEGLGLIPGWGRFPREGNGNPLQYSCLGNPMDRGTWRATIHGVAESDTTEHSQAAACIDMHVHLEILRKLSISCLVAVQIRVIQPLLHSVSL